ncbi:MAG TPA: hypothetical protein VJM15_06290 [Sphingomicrobium sp.]|nr:hypothetical protein [Sphingomicrobium sp.]
MKGGSLDRLDGALGRLLFRAIGSLFAIVAGICLYVAYRYATDWRLDSWLPALMFMLIGAAFGSVVPYCFSRRRKLTEALDAMEDETPNLEDFPKR